MSAIDFGVDHKFFPAGRTPEELSVGFLVADPNSPGDFIPLSNVPTPVTTETLNPVAGLDANRKDAIEAHLKQFLDVHYNIDVKKAGEITAVKMVRARLNNISSTTLASMLRTPTAISFLRRIAEEQSQRSRIRSWVKVFFNTDPWLVVGTHTFYDSNSSAETAKTVEQGGEVTAPVVTALTHGASDQGDPSIGYTSESRSNATQSGHNVQPLVFAAKFRQVRYKLVDDHLVSCYLVEDKPVPVGFFSESESNPDDNSITSVEDIVRLIESGDIEIEFVEGDTISSQVGPEEPFFGDECYSAAQS